MVLALADRKGNKGKFSPVIWLELGCCKLVRLSKVSLQHRICLLFLSCAVTAHRQQYQDAMIPVTNHLNSVVPLCELHSWPGLSGVAACRAPKCARCWNLLPTLSDKHKACGTMRCRDLSKDAL